MTREQRAATAIRAMKGKGDMAPRGRPAGQMTPLRRKALAVIREHMKQGRPVMVVTIARRLGVDRRSARRIIADVGSLSLN